MRGGFNGGAFNKGRFNGGMFGAIARAVAPLLVVISRTVSFSHALLLRIYRWRGTPTGPAHWEKRVDAGREWDAASKQGTAWDRAENDAKEWNAGDKRDTPWSRKGER